jgi:hypothetical protein
VADNEYDPDEQPPVPDLRPRLTVLLPRDTFADFTQWPGWEPAAVNEGDGVWLSVTMPPGWELRTGSTGLQLLWGGDGRARFLVLSTGLRPVNEEEALAYA